MPSVVVRGAPSPQTLPLYRHRSVIGSPGSFAVVAIVFGSAAGIQLLRFQERSSTTAAAGGPGIQRAPDISNLTPRQQADRLYERIIQASQAGDAAEIAQFTPMALAAYQRVGPLDPDARYHLGVIHTINGNYSSASAQLDSLRRESSTHLFVSLLAGALARVREDSTALRNVYRTFLANYSGEIATDRNEYEIHQNDLDAFRREAEAVLNP